MEHAAKNAEGTVRAETGVRARADSSRACLLARLLAKLEYEQFDRREHVGPYVDGWTDRGASLADWLRIEIGLAELRAHDVDFGGEA